MHVELSCLHQMIWVAILDVIHVVCAGTMCTRTGYQPGHYNGNRTVAQSSNRCAMVISPHSAFHWKIDTRACPHGTQLYSPSLGHTHHATQSKNDFVSSHTSPSPSHTSHHIQTQGYSRHLYLISYTLPEPSPRHQ